MVAGCCGKRRVPVLVCLSRSRPFGRHITAPLPLTRPILAGTLQGHRWWEPQEGPSEPQALAAARRRALPELNTKTQEEKSVNSLIVLKKVIYFFTQSTRFSGSK